MIDIVKDPLQAVGAVFLIAIAVSLVCKMVSAVMTLLDKAGNNKK